MSTPIHPRTRYMQKIAQFPLSKIIQDVEPLFSGDLRLSYKSAEQTEEGNCREHTRGHVLGFSDGDNEKLFFYSGILYETEYETLRVCPRKLFLGIDFENSKLTAFLKAAIQKIPYANIFNVLGPQSNMIFGKSQDSGDPLFLSIESHKTRKKGIYENIRALTTGSGIEDLKKILNSKI
ncbi:MAG: hypothetical protein Q8L27_03435 [archaeon]|nr:hypothetical protein [archaeon]